MVVMINYLLKKVTRCHPFCNYPIVGIGWLFVDIERVT